MLQELVNKLVNWLHRDEIAKFDRDHADLIKGRQFPNKEAISKQLDFAIENFDGNKITTDFLSHYKENVDVGVVGADDTTGKSETH